MKDKKIIYGALLLGIGAIAYFMTKKKGENVDETEKSTSDVGNDKNDKVLPELTDKFGMPKVYNQEPIKDTETDEVIESFDFKSADTFAPTVSPKTQLFNL